MYYAAAWGVDELNAKAGGLAGINWSGWPVLHQDKREPLNDRKARRPSRAIQIVWLLRPRQTEARRPAERDDLSIPSHRLLVEQAPFGPFGWPALKLDVAQRNIGRLGLMLFM